MIRIVCSPPMFNITAGKLISGLKDERIPVSLATVNCAT